MSIMQVEVVSGEQKIYSGEATFIVVPTVQGELGIYPRHEPIMSLVRPGALRLTVPGEDKEVLVAVSGGILEVQPDKVTVLADVAVRSAEMDRARAEEAKKPQKRAFPKLKTIRLWRKHIKHWLPQLHSSKLWTISVRTRNKLVWFEKHDRLVVLFIFRI